MSVPKSPLLRRIREWDRLLLFGGKPPAAFVVPLSMVLRERQKTITIFEDYCKKNNIKFEVASAPKKVKKGVCSPCIMHSMIVQSLKKELPAPKFHSNSY